MVFVGNNNYLLWKILLISCFLYTCVGKGGNPWIKQFVEYLGSSSEEGDKLRDLVKRHYEGAPDLSLWWWSGYKTHMKKQEISPHIWNHPVMAVLYSLLSSARAEKDWGRRLCLISEVSPLVLPPSFISMMCSYTYSVLNNICDLFNWNYCQYILPLHLILNKIPYSTMLHSEHKMHYLFSCHNILPILD